MSTLLSLEPSGTSIRWQVVSLLDTGMKGLAVPPLDDESKSWSQPARY